MSGSTSLVGFPHMRKWVAQNMAVPVEVLRLLAHDGDPQVRWHVAMKRKLPADLVRLLANDDDESVRARASLTTGARIA